MSDVVFLKYFQIIHKDLLSGGVPTTEDSAPVALTCQQSSSQAATELTTDCSELATQNNQYHQPTTTKSSASLKLSPKLQLTQQPHLVMVKSAGQQHEFKALSLSSDLTQVQEKLATLDHFGMKEFFIIIPCILCLHIYLCNNYIAFMYYILRCRKIRDFCAHQHHAVFARKSHFAFFHSFNNLNFTAIFP